MSLLCRFLPILLPAFGAAAPDEAVLTEPPPLASSHEAPKSSLTHPVELLFFESIPTEEPVLYDARNEINCPEGSASPLHLGIKYVVPQGGPGPDTGLLIELGGISPADCPPYEGTFSFEFPPGEPGHDPTKVEWVDDRDLILARVYYRNISYRPYDYGKYQVVDVLRALATLLERYPQIDRRRIYLSGGSGGGHLALQILRVVPEAFAEVYVGSAITRITTSIDVGDGPYAGDANGNVQGWNVNLGFPVTKPAFMDHEEFERKVAERNLRSPQRGLRRWAPIGSHYPAIFVIHGDADPTVSFQHFIDLLDALEVANSEPADFDGEHLWLVENWTFLGVPGGNHSLAGGPPDRNTRSKSINAVNPVAFTATRPTADFPVIDVTLPPEEGGWTYHFEGGLAQPGSITLTTLQVIPSAAFNIWHMY